MSTAFKKIKDYTSEELDAAIKDAVEYCDKKSVPTPHTTLNLNFYKILNGIDAYFERRRRKESYGAATDLELTERIEIIERKLGDPS